MKSTKKWTYIIPIVVAVMLIYFAVSMLTASFSMVYVEAAQYATVTKKTSSDAYILRNESYITNDKSGVIYYNIEDGEKVAAGGVIATIYESETDVINITKVKNLEKEIGNLKKLNAMSQVLGVSLESINKSLSDNLTDFIIDVSNNNFTSATNDMDNLLYSLNEKQITTGVVTDFNKRLSKLEQEKVQLQQGISPAVGQVISPVAGVFTTQLDGKEFLYDYNNGVKITYANVKNAIGAEASEIPSNAVGKIISDVNWYICCPMTKKEANEFKEISGLIDIEIPFVSADLLSARVKAVNDDPKGENSVVVLECENMNDTLAKIRSEKVEIAVRSYSGIKVPVSAIHKDKAKITTENSDGTVNTKEKEVDGVYILYGNEIKFREIVKLYQQGNYVICDTDVNNEKLYSDTTIELYDKIVTEGTNLYAGKIVKQSTEIE
ncbi:MAG: HlyD family efflux transporter periplasmic adaptor subunit [Acutalibacteraceae bacterium]